MATSGFLKVDRSSLKTVAMKETPFNASDFPTKAKDAYNYIANPNSQEEVSVTKPQLNSTIGVKLGADTNTSLTTASWGGFIERPANKRGYYFPLDSNLNGYDLQDMIEDSYENKIKAYLKDHPEVVPEGYKPTFVEGRDVCWNQLIPHEYNSSNFWGNASEVTYGDGYLKISNISAVYGGLEIHNTTLQSGGWLASHKYLLMYSAKAESDSQVIVCPSFNLYSGTYDAQLTNQYLSNTGWNHIERIFSPARDSSADTNYVWFFANYGATWATPGAAYYLKELRIVDLTIIFGSGNEPTTTDDSRIADIKAYLAEHPEYSAGAIIVANNIVELRNEEGNLFSSTIEDGTYNIFSGIAIKSDSTTIERCSSPIRVEPNTTYTISKGNSGRFDMWVIGLKEDGETCVTDGTAHSSFHMMIGQGTNLNPVTFTTTESTHYILFYNTHAGDITRRLDSVQIEKGSVATPYTPYNPPITLTLPPICQDLHGLPSAKDKMEFVNKTYENMVTVDLSTLNWSGSAETFWYSSGLPYGDKISKVYGFLGDVTDGNMSSMPYNTMANNGDKSAGIKVKSATRPTGIIHYQATSGGQRYKARVLEKKVGIRNLVASEWIPVQRDSDPLFYSTNVIADAKESYNILNASGAIRLTQVNGATRLSYPNGTDLSKVDLRGVLLYELATPQLLDVTEVVPMKPAEERIPNIVGSFSTGYENDGLCTYEGAFPSRTSIVNLIDNSTVKNNWVNAVVSVIGHTPINARDGISILPSNMSNDTRRTFSFTPTTTGKYHFSFYARLSGDARSYSSSSLRGISLTISPNPTASYDIAAPRLIRGSNIYNLEYEWNRYGKCISLNANTTYTITLNWYASNNWRRPDTPLKICGVLLESGSFLSPYDVKGTDINGTGRSITSVIRPLFFNLARLDGALEDPTKSWMVTYLRKINTNSQATGSNTHGDNFGIGNYGYSGNNILGGTSTGEQASDYYNCWEKVIFYHKANEDEFKYEVFNTETNKHYSIVRSDSSITHQTVGNIQYNLSLGTLVASSSLQESDNAQYRDLLYVPNVTEEEYLAEINKYFEVEKVRMTYEKTGEDPITVTDALTIKKTNLLEGSTLEY